MPQPSAVQQRERGIFVYPAGGWRRAMFKLPLIGWRMGLEPLMRPMRLIVLTTRGRITGRPRRTMLEHTYLNGHVYIAPGWGNKTQWYMNVLSEPRVTVQRNGKACGAKARLVTDAAELTALYQHGSKSPVWRQYLESWGIEDTLEDFLAKKDRIPTLRLDVLSERPPMPPLRVDLWWVWIAIVIVGLFLWKA
jgi:deazaflavin-dependent oxidoreductase (nitroreductase family)